jgi:hypothetical protein
MNDRMRVGACWLVARANGEPGLEASRTCGVELPDDVGDEKHM